MSVQRIFCLLGVLLMQIVQILKEASFVRVSLASLVMVEVMEMDAQVYSQQPSNDKLVLIMH